MKLATLCNGTADGQLIVVSRDLKRATRVPHIARRLQDALDQWGQVAEQLRDVYDALNVSTVVDDVIDLDPSKLMSPLPRAYQWADGSAYVNHVELVRKARGAQMPESFWTDPLMYQGGSDAFLGPCDPIRIEEEAWGIDFESEIAVVTDRVAMGATEDQAADGIRLLMLVNDVSLRNLIPAELGKGFGFFHSKPASAFSPVAVTPDELGEYWRDGKVHLPLLSYVNGTLFGRPNAGVDMTFNFPRLVAHAARTRHLSAGSIIGSGTVSNRDRSVGSSCIAERRMLETIEGGSAQTPFLKFGDRVRIDMQDSSGHSVFGVIEQIVEQYKPVSDARTEAA